MSLDYSENLIRFLPAKFQEIERVQDLCEKIGEILDDLDLEITGLADLLSADNIPTAYWDRIAAILGMELYRTSTVSTGETTAEETVRLRMFLKALIDIIKTKTSKQGLIDLMEFIFPQLRGILWTVYDLYTKDYQEFKTYGPDVDSDLYLSPHFLVEFPETVYNDLGNGDEELGREILGVIENKLLKYKPAHTVLHINVDVPAWIVGVQYTTVGLNTGDDIIIGGILWHN